MQNYLQIQENHEQIIEQARGIRTNVSEPIQLPFYHSLKEVQSKVVEIHPMFPLQRN